MKFWVARGATSGHSSMVMRSGRISVTTVPFPDHSQSLGNSSWTMRFFSLPPRSSRLLLLKPYLQMERRSAV